MQSRRLKQVVAGLGAGMLSVFLGLIVFAVSYDEMERLRQISCTIMTPVEHVFLASAAIGAVTTLIAFIVCVAIFEAAIRSGGQ